MSYPWGSEGNTHTRVDESKHSMEMIRLLSYVWHKASTSASRDNDLKQSGLNRARKQNECFTCEILESHRGARRKSVSAWKDSDERRRNEDFTVDIFDLDRPGNEPD